MQPLPWIAKNFNAVMKLIFSFQLMFGACKNTWHQFSPQVQQKMPKYISAKWYSVTGITHI